MQVSLLNEKITFQMNMVMTDEIGNHKNGWIDYYTCHATINGEGKSNTENNTAGGVLDESEIAFTIRWCKKADSFTSIGCRILFRGEVYNILSIDHMNYKKKCIKFRCQKVRR